MARIAFLGLGQMGAPMAARLLQAGHDLAIWDRTPTRAAPLVESGAVAAASPAAAADGVDYAITMLATPDALRQVVLGQNGLAAALHPGQVLIDMSTVGPEAVHAAAAGLQPGVAAVDAPVRGSVPQANAGQLDIFVGASDEDFERVRPILETLGSLIHTGGLGSGAAMKLVANLALGAAIATLGEALALGEAQGLERSLVLDVLGNSPIGPTVRAKRANIEADDYPPSFKLGLADKDLGLVTDTAARLGWDLKVARAARAWLDGAMQQGASELDYAAVVRTIVNQKAPMA
jgi:3-hydroxyisobutyrate dehydrogenase-like beta-hydroxyacid dehydrogenase